MELNQQQLKRCIQTAIKFNCPRDQVDRFLKSNHIPLPWQWEFHSLARQADSDDGPVDIGLGGARGPGKSHAVLAQTALDDCQRVSNLKGLFLRQTGVAAQESFSDLIDKVVVGRVEYRRTGQALNFPNGSRIILGGFKDERDIDKYIGIEYDFIIVEELNQLTKEKYDKLRGSLRTSKPNWRPRMYVSFNPGGIGHAFVRSRYVIPQREKKEKETRFVGSTYKSNPYLNKEYIDYLEGLTGDLGKAWREGEWEIFAGQVFSEWRQSLHVIKRIIPRKNVTDILGMDWGYAKTSAFAATLNSLSNLQTQDGQKYNQIVTYREWYGNLKSPREWARIIYNDCLKMNKHPKRCISDPSMHSTQTGSNSIAQTIENEWKKLNGGTNWCRIEKGSNSGRNSRVNRVGMMHEWLSVNPATKMPYWVVTENCVNFIRTIPMLVHDKNLVEAYDTSGDDHCGDQASYLLEKIKFVSVKPGSYSALKGEKKVYLGTDERGLPIVDPKMFFGTVS